MGFTSMGTYFYKVKKRKIIDWLTCVLKENYKYAQKQNLKLKKLLFKT